MQNGYKMNIVTRRKKYANGDFTLKKISDYGQLININITLPNKADDGYVTIKSGWLVYPDGKIQLATVFAGKVK